MVKMSMSIRQASAGAIVIVFGVSCHQLVSTTILFTKITSFLKEIEFMDGSLLKLKSYIEVYLEQPTEFKLLLVEVDSDEIVWKAKLRECKCFCIFY